MFQHAIANPPSDIPPNEATIAQMSRMRGNQFAVTSARKITETARPQVVALSDCLHRSEVESPDCQFAGLLSGVFCPSALLSWAKVSSLACTGPAELPF